MTAGIRRYRIMISAPCGPAPEGGYPVLYVLDAEAYFDAALAIARMREYEKLDPLLIVGIGNPEGFYFDLERSRDFTPKNPASGTDSGGAKQFRRFIAEDLKPLINAQYAIDADRQTLFGHSLGAVFALDTLMETPGAFDLYVAASLSVRYADRLLASKASRFRLPRGAKQPRLLATAGGLESHPSLELVDDYRRWFAKHPEALGGQDAEAALKELFPDDLDFDKSAEIAAIVRRLQDAGVAAEFVEFPGEEHLSSGISALNRAIPFALRPPK
jgi:predicted alpha/beta superfamily hydrolase